MNTTFIYILIDPMTGQIRYVGKTNNLQERYKNHKNPCRDKNTHKRNWINKLRRLGHHPIIEVIDEIPIKEWKYWEKFWISYFKFIGCDLVNHCSGGEGLSFGNQTSFKNGSKPWNKGKTHSQETKEKLRRASTGQISSRRKPVEQYTLSDELVKVFDSCHHAAKALKTNAIRISDVCNNKRKTHKKYKWKFKNQ